MPTKDGSRLAVDARCLGSIPTLGHKNDESGFVEGTSYKDADGHYTLDNERLLAIDRYRGKVGRLNTTEYGQSYWFASRGRTNNGNAYGIFRRSNSSVGSDWLFGAVSRSVTHAFIPVFILNSEVKIVSGTGTEDDPFEIQI